MMIFVESVFMCFVLLIVCVVGMANGPVGLVCLYEKDVQDRVVELGLTTRARIKRNALWSSVAMLVPAVVMIPYMVYSINGAATFAQGFGQMTLILWGMGLFDRLFIDWYWVAHTKAWFIPGTEDLMPYIPTKTRVFKWVGTVVGYPLIAAVVAGVMTFIVK